MGSCATGERVCKGLFWVYIRLFGIRVYAALLNVYRALLSECI